MSALPTMSGRALIAAGGTGGHVYPALAVAGLLTEQGWSVDWVGTERGIEQRLVPAAGLPCITSACLDCAAKIGRGGHKARCAWSQRCGSRFHSCGASSLMSCSAWAAMPLGRRDSPLG